MARRWSSIVLAKSLNNRYPETAHTLPSDITHAKYICRAAMHECSTRSNCSIQISQSSSRQRRLKTCNSLTIAAARYQTLGLYDSLVGRCQAGAWPSLWGNHMKHQQQGILVYIYIMYLEDELLHGCVRHRKHTILDANYRQCTVFLCPSSLEKSSTQLYQTIPCPAFSMSSTSS